MRKTLVTLALLGTLALSGCATTIPEYDYSRVPTYYYEARQPKRVTPLVVQPEEKKNSWGTTGDWLSLIGLAGMLDKNTENDAAGRIAYEAGQNIQQRDVAKEGAGSITINLQQKRAEKINNYVKIMQDEQGNIYPFNSYIWAYLNDPNDFSVIKTKGGDTRRISYTYLNWHDENRNGLVEWTNGEVEGIRDVYNIGESVNIYFEYGTLDNAAGRDLRFRLYGPKGNLVDEATIINSDGYGYAMIGGLANKGGPLKEPGTYTVKWFDDVGNFLHDHSFGIVE